MGRIKGCMFHTEYMVYAWFFCKGVGTSSLEPLSEPSSAKDNCCVKAEFNARTKHPNKASSDNWHRVWLVEVQKKWV